MSNPINHKRVMLANLKTGQRISYIVFKQGQPRWVEAEIIRIEIEQNCGRLWTTSGSLPLESLTSKYEVVQE
jgi:hypothetical protein